MCEFTQGGVTMAIAASVLSQRFMRTNRFSQAIDAFFKREDKAPAKAKSSIENDLLELSPMNQMRQTITQFRQQTSVQSELKVKLTFNTRGIEEGADGDVKLERDLDLMLRIISKDDKEYATLKARYEKMMKLAQTNVAESSSEARVSAQSAAVQESETAQTGVEIPQNGKPMTLAQMIAVQESRTTMQLDLKFKQTTTAEGRIGITLEELGIKKVDPLVLDLSGEGINLTEAGKGAIFDITADGKLDSTAWVRGNTAMLVYDRNGNGVIDNGSELFGDQNGAEHGFAELAKYDSNGDNKINFLDPIFKALKLYRDLNGDGKIDKNELQTLPELGIKALNLNFMRTNADIKGNSLVLTGNFEREDGSTGQLADVLLGYRKV
ncbi:MAG: hypothetical protein CVV41_04260 [Candidatus Riflebacteria bacterium HGW-Riflebacteria-1]|jgi:hypothetical protein|nr:MAG: hypothetical protein CVV41_04260 [Candidatus Riflebacteria bacterium HGW-Riflebacteria-1]